MNKNVKGAIVVGSTLLVGFGVYTLFFSYARDKKLVLKSLASEFGKIPEHEPFVNKADKGYIKAWAKAIRKGEQFFYFNGRKFNTSGGRTAQ